MGINLVLSKLLDQSLSLVEGQELGNADTDEGRLILYREAAMHQPTALQWPDLPTYRIFKLGVDLGDDGPH